MFQDLTVPSDSFAAPLTRGERIIRGVVVIGFMGVLGLEAWLLWQIWQIWN
jgi:hypothetical protein